MRWFHECLWFTALVWSYYNNYTTVTLENRRNCQIMTPDEHLPKCTVKLTWVISSVNGCVQVLPITKPTRQSCLCCEMDGPSDAVSLFSRLNAPPFVQSSVHHFTLQKANGSQVVKMFSGLERDFDADMMRAYQLVQELAEQISHNKNIIAQLQHQANSLKVI